MFLYLNEMFYVSLFKGNVLFLYLNEMFCVSVFK